jgi:hypothetical protein
MLKNRSYRRIQFNFEKKNSYVGSDQKTREQLGQPENWNEQKAGTTGKLVLPESLTAGTNTTLDSWSTLPEMYPVDGTHLIF